MGWFLFFCALVAFFLMQSKCKQLQLTIKRMESSHQRTRMADKEEFDDFVNKILKEHKLEVSTLKKAIEKEKKEFDSLLNSTLKEHKSEVNTLKAEIRVLEKYYKVIDAEKEAKDILENARLKSKEIISKSINDSLKKNNDLEEKRIRIEDLLKSANTQAEKIIADAKVSAEKIAGDAYRALKESDDLKGAADAMRNVIDGYGDRYLKPTYSLLDELAQTYGFDEAGKQLKLARERTALMVEHRRAATSEYVEHHRLKTAIEFIVDAFNGKVDSILSKSKKDNYGTLEQQIKDAFALVNHNGSAFRNTRIRPEYLEARLEELRWATAVMLVREKDREEQRAIREQMREEERARREIERALKDAEKEEAAIERAMEKMRRQIEQASEEQRQKYEADMASLQQRLQEAEARSQRAMSMAQQTKAGHVYVISNIGSFGEDVFKVGMTRRLEPLDRVRELGDASVPFAFDVHAMLWSEDAPALERALHIEFAKAQVNKVNPRKEFFRVPLAELKAAVEQRGIEASWTLAAEAAEYRETLAIEQSMKQDEAQAQAWLQKQAAFEQEQEHAQTLILTDED